MHFGLGPGRPALMGHCGPGSSLAQAPDEVTRSHDKNSTDPSAQVAAEVPDVPGDEMRRIRGDGGFENGNVLFRQPDAGRKRRIGFPDDPCPREEVLEPGPLVGGRQIPARFLKGIGGGEELHTRKLCRVR